jgi:hypothetical protein
MADSTENKSPLQSPQREIIDPDYQGVSPDAPLINFRDPRNAKRAGVPQTKRAILDDRASEYFGIE